MCERIILVPVGTSVVLNFDQERELRNSLSDDRRRNFIKQHFKNIRCQIGSVANVFNHRDRQEDKNPAEISSLYAFWLKELKGQVDDIRIKVVLIHSPEIGKVCAQLIEKLILDNQYFPTNGVCWQVELFELEDLDPMDAKKFPQSLNRLADLISRQIADFSGEVYVNISGGYKALGPYLTMMAMVLGRRIKVFYLFEKSPEVLFLPTYPLAFDLLEWRDWRGLLLPFTTETLLTDIQKEAFLAALQGTKVGSLIEKTNSDGIGLNSIGLLLKSQYDFGSDAAVSEFGQGHLLLDRFTDCIAGKTYKNYLSTQCIPRWRHLAVGDHIPETVEHGRGHVQRLLELAQQLLIAADIELSNEQLFVLISSIWLHDLGHTGNHFTFEGNNGLIRDKDDHASTKRFYVYGDPDEVRSYHNFLSYELIKNERNFLFPRHALILPDGLKLRLLRSIALACLYHRKKMPVNRAGKKVDQCYVLKAITDFKDDEVIEGFAEVAAMLRVLDGAENQQERSGSNECHEVAKWVIARQVASMQNSPDYSSDERLQRECKFKANQPKHFNKHRMVRNVFFIREDYGSIESFGIYGSNTSDGENPLVSACLMANPNAADNREYVIKEIVSPFLEEFLLVKDLLSFNLVLIYVKNQGNDTILDKAQIVITPEDGEPEKWKSKNWLYKFKKLT